MADAAEPIRVLVVDDEKIIADSLALILQGAGYTVRSAYCAKPAMEIADEFKPEILVSDVMMPDMNGVALADHFFHSCPNCKVVLMSGNANSRALLVLAAERGQNYAFIQKPFHPRVLLEVLEGFRDAK